MVNDDRWDELRAFDHYEPSTLAFRALIALLDTWPENDQAAAIAYAENVLSRWPDTVRLAPWSWCKAASKGIVQPTWQLIRTLQLASGHLTKDTVDLSRLAHRASLDQLTELEIPRYSSFKELSLLYHRADLFPKLKHLRATDKYNDGEVRALTRSALWRTLEAFETEPLTESFAHNGPSRIVPQLETTNPIQSLSLKAADLIAAWDANDLPQIRSLRVFIRSIDEAEELSRRSELSQIESLSLAFRCGFSGSSPFEPFLGTVIEADEAAAETFFQNAQLARLQSLTIAGYSMGYWGREGLGRLGLTALIRSGLLNRLKSLRLECLPLGDEGVAALSPALGTDLESLALVDVYCKGEGAASLAASPCMPSLRELDLSANRIDAKHAARLASVPMPHLESLDLSGPTTNPYYWNVGVQPLLDSGATAWANSDNTKRLKRLRLSNCHLTDAALTAIFQSSDLPALVELDLSHNCFTTAGISQINASPLWQTLNRLILNNCRLDNDAIKSLCTVSHAPALRSLELAYNSIGPDGTVALASWPILANVWELNLHDNVIGNEGLIALAQSPNLSRLLELDLEQDCWNSRSFTFSDAAASALSQSTALPRLDCLWSGCVDEYHGTAYSPGFTKDAIELLRKSKWMRPALQIAIGDFSGIDEYYESGEYDENRELTENDFRSHPFQLNEKEAEQTPQRMRQLSTPRSPDRPIEQLEPAKISPLPEIVVEEPDAVEDPIEGLSNRDPVPVTDHFTMLSLSLEDEQRPLPKQVGKYLSDTLGSIFHACSIGKFEIGGGGSRKCDDGSYVDTDVTFYVSVKGDREPAIELIREAMWWIGAPEETGHPDLPLTLSVPPQTNQARFLQLALPTVFRWKSGHRIDRVAFTKAQRETVQKILHELNTVKGDDGWVQTVTDDGGRLSTYTKYIDTSTEFCALNLLVETLTPEVSELAYQLMRECGLLIFPMALAADDTSAKLLDCDWPIVSTVSSAAALHEVLVRGAYHRWQA